MAIPLDQKTQRLQTPLKLALRNEKLRVIFLPYFLNPPPKCREVENSHRRAAVPPNLLVPMPNAGFAAALHYRPVTYPYYGVEQP